MNFLNQLFSKVTPLPVGTHHMQAEEDGRPYRLHLRLNQDGSGLLILNASTIMQLNPTAAEYAFHFVKGSDPEEAAKQVAKRYRVDRMTALDDYQEFVEKIQALISTPDLDPVSILNFDQAQPHTAGSVLRLDCAVTYKLPSETQVDYAPVKRVDRELTTTEWQSVMDKAWHAGVPHVIFTGGEATLREDLPQLIAHAEKNGQVCGLLTDGLKLAQKEYLEMLLQTGLDHVMVILQPDQPLSWEAIEIILPQDLFLTVHLTVTPQNAPEAKGILSRLAELGVQNISLSAAAPSVAEGMIELQNAAGELQMTVRWDLPVPYSASNPAALEMQDDDVPSGAGRSWLYVEPDGDVLPSQGEADKVLGNLLRDEWAAVLK